MFIVGREYIRRSIISEEDRCREGYLPNYIYPGESGGEYGYKDVWKDESIWVKGNKLEICSLQGETKQYTMMWKMVKIFICFNTYTAVWWDF